MPYHDFIARFRTTKVHFRSIIKSTEGWSYIQPTGSVQGKKKNTEMLLQGLFYCRRKLLRIHRWLIQLFYCLYKFRTD